MLFPALFLFVSLNAMAFMQAWSLTHYVRGDEHTKQVERFTSWDKVHTVVSGPTVMRMRNVYTPERYGLTYETVQFPGYQGIQLSAWRIAGDKGAAAVLLFHGFGASKDTLLRAATEFHALGCETWLVDFHGSGDSLGTTNSVGYHEAEDVRAAVQFASSPQYGTRPIVLYGTSMGAASILCAAHRGLVNPDAMILECPFDRLVTTVGNRCGLLGIPAFPMADLLVFWSSVQSGFNGFEHNPVEYAHSVRCPTLLFQGERDQMVGLAHGKAIAAALGTHGTFKVFPGLGHAFLVHDGEPEWRDSVRSFLSSNKILSSAQTQ